MIDHIANLKLAIVVIICVLVLFFFPVARGPFSAVHGPVSANRSRNFAYLFFDSIRRIAVSRLRQMQSATRAGMIQLRMETMAARSLPEILAFDLRC